MTTNQTIDGVLVSRDLLERLNNLTRWHFGNEAECVELRALLDEPANRCGEPVAWQYRIVEDGRPLFNPIKKDGWIDTAEGVAKDMTERPSLGKNRRYEVRKLYAEQPAPVVIEHYKNKVKHLKQLLRNVRATLQFSPEDVVAIDAALREDDQ